MASVIQMLKKRGIGSQPNWLAENMHYETIMGSEAYAVSSGGSDIDIYGFCIPRKSDIFPHLRGEIPGFGRQIARFEQYQEHHLDAPEHRKTYDVSIYSIVKYFHLCMDNNPNMIDSLFTPERCVRFATPVARMVRDARRDFLSKRAWDKFRGYASAQFHKMETKTHSANETRQADIQAYGYSTKYAYHLVRLLLECEQILIHNDINLERDSEFLKSIRRGEWSLPDLKRWHGEKLIALETVHTNSKIAERPDEDRIKKLLLQCLEHHYGSIADAVKVDVDVESLISDMQSVLDRYKKN